jgi:tetrathionate reductase subunit B
LIKRFGMVIDQERCIGCEACTVACKTENKFSGYAIRVRTENTTQKGTPEGRFPDLKMTFLPRLCNHCSSPPCVDICPKEALIKREDGPVILDEARCDGCKACMEVCPYDAVGFNPDTDTAEKCNLCVHRIDQGLEPFCVICCEGQAIHFGDLNDPDSPVSRLIAARKIFQLIPGTGTGPSVYYCPPKEPRRL